MIVITGAFVISRVILKILGVQFYGSFVYRMWQTIDLTLLKSQLIESIFYSHAQPPMFNLLNGLVVKVFTAHYYLVFHMIQFGLSFASALLIYFTLKRLGVSRMLGAVTSLFFILNPALILYENIYSYTLLTIFLVTLLIYVVIRFLQNRSDRNWLMFLGVAGVMALTRSSFHLSWLLALMLILLYRSGFNRRRMISASVCVLLVSGWYIKNLVLYDTFSSSSWMGMSLARIVKLDSPLGKIGPFKTVREYRPLLTMTNPVNGVDVLDNEWKVKFQYINFNHYAYLEVSEKFKDEAIAEIMDDPHRYVTAVGRSFVTYFIPATHAPFVGRNRSKMRDYTSIVALHFNYQGSPDRYHYFPLTHALPAIGLHLLVLMIVAGTWKGKLWSHDDRTLMLVLAFLLTYGMLVGNLLEYGENNRFRFETQPAFLILFVLTISRFFKIFRNSYGQNHSM